MLPRSLTRSRPPPLPPPLPQVSTLEKNPAGHIYCENWKPHTGKPVTNQQRKAKALGMVAHLGLKNVQKVNEVSAGAWRCCCGCGRLASVHADHN